VKIAGLQKVSLLDYPGHIAASVFVAGCNLDCGYCQNHWMIDAAQVREAITMPALLDWLRTRVGLIDGVCVSGGEPTIHAELPELLQGIRTLGLLVKLDTNGTRPGALRALLDAGLADYVAMDLKAPMDARYERMAGRPVDLVDVRASMAALRTWDPTAQRYEFRTTGGPGLDVAALRDLAREIAPRERWLLQPYVPPKGTAERAVAGEAVGADELVALARELAVSRPGVSVRGEE
jgi:pyruvate formate lyase activating enzyme